MIRCAGTIVAALLLAGCCDSRFGMPERDDTLPPATATLAYLRQCYAGEPFTVEGDITVEGRVTTSDRAGNFYRTLCIESAGAALEVMAGGRQLYLDYPVGSRVVLHLRGLTLAQSRGVLQAGAPAAPGSGYPTDYIASRPALDAHLTCSDEPPAVPEAAVRTIPSLDPQLCGTLVRVEGLRYLPDPLGEASLAGERRFADERGHTLRLFVRTYADFAAEEPPTGLVALTGILQCDAEGYLLKPRSLEDLEPWIPPVVLE